MSVVHVIGDVHGQFETLSGLLREAGLIGKDGAWRGADSVLWLMGDLVDRGPGGIEAIDLAMRLEREAARAGGRVSTLLGNHDLLLMAAHCLGDAPSSGPGETFRDEWERNGGQQRDLERLTRSHVRWLADLPAMAHEQGHLLVHADALFYVQHGQSVAGVNAALRDLVQSADAARWDQLLEAFGEHRAFHDANAGVARAAAFLEVFGGQRIVHGHSPIGSMTRQPASSIRKPLHYAGGRCVNVDGGMYQGSPGFVYRLPVLAERD